MSRFCYFGKFWVALENWIPKTDQYIINYIFAPPSSGGKGPIKLSVGQ